jgi:hypothetical protein
MNMMAFWVKDELETKNKDVDINLEEQIGGEILKEILLKAEHMVKEFGATKAIKDVTVELNRGEVMQLTAKYRVATPANWKQGEDVIIAGSVSDEEAKKLFPQGWKAVKPYLRVTRQPGS